MMSAQSEAQWEGSSTRKLPWEIERKVRYCQLRSVSNEEQEKRFDLHKKVIKAQ